MVICLLDISQIKVGFAHLLYQGRRNVFTTGPAKLHTKDYAIKCMGGR